MSFSSRGRCFFAAAMMLAISSCTAPADSEEALPSASGPTAQGSASGQQESPAANGDRLPDLVMLPL